jgi:hypothetical protein
MTEDDTILSKPVGHYRNNAGFKTPFFAARETSLTQRNIRSTQVLIMAFGGLQWINVKLQDIEVTDG